MPASGWHHAPSLLRAAWRPRRGAPARRRACRRPRTAPCVTSWWWASPPRIDALDRAVRDSRGRAGRWCPSPRRWPGPRRGSAAPRCRPGASGDRGCARPDRRRPRPRGRRPRTAPRAASIARRVAVRLDDQLDQARGRIVAVAIAGEAQHVRALLAVALAGVHAQALGAELDQDRLLRSGPAAMRRAEIERRPRPPARRRRETHRRRETSGSRPAARSRSACASASEHRVALVAYRSPGRSCGRDGRPRPCAGAAAGRGARVEGDRVERLAQPELGVEPDQVEQLAAAPSCSRARP